MTDLAAPVTDLPAERHIPLPVAEVVDLAAAGLPPAEGERLRRLADLLGALLHSRYRSRWRTVRDLEVADDHEGLVRELRAVLDAANYDEVPREALERALGEASLFKVRLHVDLDHFAELLFFRRGTRRRSEVVSRWRGLRHEQVDYVEYARVVMYARHHDRAWFEERGVDLDDLPFEPGRAVMKLFQDVPEADLEMLLPGTEVRMRTFDKVLFGVPAVVGGAVVAATKLAAALGLLLVLVGAALGLHDQPNNLNAGSFITLLGGLVAFGAYLWRQWTKYKNRRLSFLQTLSEHLYFKAVADGAGVLFTVLDAAEEEDVKEALLGYRALLDGPAPAGEVDARAERLLRDPCDGRVDFEVSDALGKLARLGLADERDGRWHGVPLDEALRALRARWRELGDAMTEPAPR